MRGQMYIIIFICSFLQFFTANAQVIPTLAKNEYGLEIINDENSYRQIVLLDSNQKMISLRSIIPNIILDLRYATSNNFMHKKMYPSNPDETYLRLQGAKALAFVQHELNEQGLGLKIFDAYRPYSVTKDFWKQVHDERYVANPAKGSGHNLGIAVDLTIIDLKTAKELDMGTGFDNFTDSAHQNFIALPENSLNNRELLRTTMKKYGFIMYDTEWWHYAWPNDYNYAILDLSFEELKHLSKVDKQ